MLKGERITLRPVDIDDVKYFMEWRMEPEGNYFDEGKYETPKPDELRKNLIEYIENGKYKDRYIILDEENNPIGNILHRSRPKELEEKIMFIAIRLGKKHWNKGYGTDATKTLIKWMFKTFDIKTIRLSVLDFNERAIAVYKKCGFKIQEKVKDDNDLWWYIMDLQKEDFGICLSH